MSLPRHRQRIAIDGFGFGGANAHVVIESTDTEASSDKLEVAFDPSDDELVVVACDRMVPTLSTALGSHFDRSAMGLPEGCVVLPELADDMDISQALTTILAKNIIDHLGSLDDRDRQNTSLIVALRGKTERGVEATLRILAPRLRRRLDGCESVMPSLDKAHDRARPSGPYTLQCMMPNVAAGRAALIHNLNGPNFVVDSGEESLLAAVRSAELLTRGGDPGGSGVVIVSAIEANSLIYPNADRRREAMREFAVAFAVTRRQLATERGWNILATVDEVIANVEQKPDFRGQVDAMWDLLRQEPRPASSTTNPPRSAAGSDEPAETSDCRIHIPIWAERARSNVRANRRDPRAVLVIVPALAETIEELLKALPKLVDSFLIVVVGDGAADLVVTFGDARLIAGDVTDDEAVFRRIHRLQPDLSIAVDSVASWQFSDSLSTVADHNNVCEFLFLAAKHEIDRLRRGETGLYGVVLDGWRGNVHPRSGALAGMLKSIGREIPSARACCISARGLRVADALEEVFAEHRYDDDERELAFDRDKRLVRRLRESSLSGGAAPLKLDSDSVVVATGGAKGVTAVMLEAILRDYRCKVVAIGRSPLAAGPEVDDEEEIEKDFYRRFLDENPKSSPLEMRKRFESARASWEAHRSIEHLRSIGGSVEYVVADVTDRHQVDEVMRQIRSRYGKVDLLIHGAGIQLSKRLEDRTIEDFRQTYAVKVAGLNHFAQSYRALFQDNLCAHVLTSAYSVFGNDGQHDYCAANETLDRICGLSRIVGETKPWSSIAWLAWDGIGMTRGSEYRVLADQRKLSGVAPTTGQAMFRDVLSGATGSAINVPVSSAEHNEYEIRTIPRGTASASRRILETAYPDRGDQVAAFPQDSRHSDVAGGVDSGWTRRCGAAFAWGAAGLKRHTCRGRRLHLVQICFAWSTTRTPTSGLLSKMSEVR